MSETLSFLNCLNKQNQCWIVWSELRTMNVKSIHTISTSAMCTGKCVFHGRHIKTNCLLIVRITFTFVTSTYNYLLIIQLYQGDSQLHSGDIDDVHFVLDQNAELDCIVLVRWSNYPRVDMSLHSDTLSYNV
jgi:hypothetical protein